MKQTDSLPGSMPLRVLFFVCTLSMITYLDRVCFGVAGPAIVESLGLRDVSELKGAFTAFAIAYSLFEVPSGWLGDRWGARRALVRIVLWWSLFTVLTGVVGWQWGDVTLGGVATLVVIRFLFGAGEAGAYPNIARAIHEWFPPEKWARVQGLVWMSGRLMGGLTPLLWMGLVGSGTGEGGRISWRTAFLGFGLVGVVWSVFFWMFFRDKPSEPARLALESPESDSSVGSPVASEKIPWKDILGQRDLWILSLAYFLVNYGWYFNITYLPSYLHDRFQVAGDSVWTALLKGGPLWVGAAGCLLGGRLADAMGTWLGDHSLARRRLAAGSLLLAGLAWSVSIQASSASVFFVLASTAAFFTDLTLGSVWATCQEIGSRSPAIATAIMNTIGTLGAAAAGWFTGSILEAGPPIDQTSRPEWSTILSLQGGYPSVFLTYFLAYTLAAIAWMFLGRAKDQPLATTPGDPP
jgi:MFS family permease